MNQLKKIFLLITFTIFITTGCGKEETISEDIPPITIIPKTEEFLSDEDQQKVTALITSMVNDKGIYSNSGNTEKYLNSIANISNNNYIEWSAIMDYWNEVNSQTFVNISLVPDNLPDDDTLCFIVLGYQLNPDGTMKDELIGRLQTALDCAKKYPSSYVLVTGGGTASSNRTATEADSMAEWLYDNGINKERVIIENKSRTTVENAIFSHKIIKNNYADISNVVIVTSDYHVPMGSLLFYEQFALAGDKDTLSVISNSAFKTDKDFFAIKSQAQVVLSLYTAVTH